MVHVVPMENGGKKISAGEMAGKDILRKWREELSSLCPIENGGKRASHSTLTANFGGRGCSTKLSLFLSSPIPMQMQRKQWLVGGGIGSSSPPYLWGSD